MIYSHIRAIFNIISLYCCLLKTDKDFVLTILNGSLPHAPDILSSIFTKVHSYNTQNHNQFTILTQTTSYDHNHT